MREQKRYKYWAFISYSSRDRKWGEWLRKRLEGYGLPKDLVGLELADGTKLPKYLRPIFRDRDELTGSADLGPAIEGALVESRFLIVLCSPNSAQSKWVDKEISSFVAMGRQRNVLALILEGEPNSGDPATECFPPSMRYPVEPLAGDLRREGDGKERGFLKVLAGVAELNFDDLYRRHERAARRRRLLAGVTAALAVAVLAGLTLFAFGQKGLAERSAELAREARARAEGQEKIAKARLAASLAEQGRQAFMKDEGVRATAFLNEARKVDAGVPGVERMLGALWRSQSGEVVRVSGERVEASAVFFPETGGELLWSDALGRVRSVSLRGRRLRLLSGAVDNSPHNQQTVLPTRGNRRAAFYQRTNPAKPDYVIREVEVSDAGSGERFLIAWPEGYLRPSMMVLSPGGDRLLASGPTLAGEPTLFLWKVGSAGMITVPLEAEGEVAKSQWYFSSDGMRLLQLRGDSDAMELVVRDGTTGDLVSKAPLPGAVEDYAFAKGRPVAVGGGYVVIGFRGGQLACFDLDQSGLAGGGHEVSGQDGILETEQVLMSQDGKLVMQIGKSGDAVLYRREGWEVIWRYGRSETDGSCRGGAISRDGKRAVLACGNGLLLFDAATGKVAKAGGFKGDGRLNLAFSPDGKLLAAGTQEGDVVVRLVEAGDDGLVTCLPDTSKNIMGLTELRPGVFLTHGGEALLLDANTGRAAKAGAGFAESSAISPDGKLVAKGLPGWGPVSVVSVAGGQAISTDGNDGGLNLFLGGERPAGVLVDNSGRFRLYDSNPQFMGKAAKCEGVAGQMTAVLREEGGERILAGFANGTFAITSIDGESLGPFVVRKPEGASGKLPVPMGFLQGVLLYSAGGALFIHDVDKDVQTALPVVEFQGARLLCYKGQILAATVNVFGQVQCWGADGKLVSSGRPVNEKSGAMYVGIGKQGAKGGRGILMDGDGGGLLTSYGNRVYMWSLPGLDILWRSADMQLTSMGGDAIMLRGYDPRSGRVVFSDCGFDGSGDTMNKLISLPVPAASPTVEEVSGYLEKVAAVAVSGGEVVPLGGE